MKSAVIVARHGLGHQSTWGQAFAAGLNCHGWRARVASDMAPCDLLVLWGVRRSDMARRHQAAGGEVCIIERGYVGDRFQWSSVSFGGGLNGRGKFYGPFADGTRWEKHFAPLMQPWHAGNRVALVMGQVTSDSAVRDVNIRKWYDNAASDMREHGFEVRFRPHPQEQRGAKPQRSLAEDLALAACVVTYNSNSGVDAVLAGVPTIAMDRGSMAWDVTGHEFKPPPTPDRAAWAHAIAWKQWRIEEMASGVCWDAVKGDL